MSNDPERWRVGQVVVIQRRYRGNSQGMVTKVGRILVTVRSNNVEEQFRMDSGLINDNYGGVYIFTQEEWDERILKSDAQSRLAAAGCRLDHTTWARLSVEQMNQISEILESASA